MATEQHSQPSDHDLIATLLEDRPVTYKPIVAKALKHTEVARKMRHVTAATVFLSNIMYWSSKKESKQVGGWAYRKAYEIEEETGLSRYEQEKARLLLVEAGVMEEATRGVPPIKHYRVLYDGLLPLLRQQLARDMGYDNEEQEQKIPANPNLLDSLSNKNETHDSQINSGDSLSNKNEIQARKSYTDKAGKKANKKVDNQSVDPSAHAALAREGISSDDKAEPTDRLTDGPTDEKPSGDTSEFPTTVQLLEEPETHHDDEQAPELSPEEGADNAAPKPEEALRQQAEAIPTSDVSPEAQSVAAGLLDVLPKMPRTDAYRVMRLAEHYHRKERSSVLTEATEKVAQRAQREKINHPWSYLTKTCAEKESYYSEEDEALLSGLTGENTSSSREEGEAASYEWFFSSDEQESGACESQQRQHTSEPDPKAQAVWEKVLEDVSGEINAPSLRVWFEGTVPVSLTSDTLTISVPNSFAKEYIESRFKELLEGALVKRLSPTSRIEIVVGVEGSTDNTDRRQTP